MRACPRILYLYILLVASHVSKSNWKLLCTTVARASSSKLLLPAWVPTSPTPPEENSAKGIPGTRQWSGLRVLRSLEEERDLMSRRPSVPDQSSNAPSSGSDAPPVSTTGQLPGLSARNYLSSPEQIPYTSSVQAGSLPPLSLLPRISDQRGSRPFGVHTILNPADTRQQSGYASGLIRPEQGITTTAPFNPAQSLTPRHIQGEATRDNVPSGRPLSGSRRASSRRTLQLRSIGAGVANMISEDVPVVATASQQSPGQSTSSRTYPTEPAGAREFASPTLPIAAPAIRTNLPVISTTLPRPAVGILNPRHGGASSTSSSASQSPAFAQASVTSPITSLASYGGRPSQQYRHSASAHPMRTESPLSIYQPLASAPERDSSSPIATAPQGNYQLMTLETEQGPFSFPVDVQAASRGADEKRRRNAGASARFRARRKEKEQQNTQEIDDLKQQIQELGEDADFYRRERDYFVAVLYNSAERDRHFPRPASPRQLRTRQPFPRIEAGGASAGAEPGRAFQEQGGRGDVGRHTRRRLTGENPAMYEEPAPGPPSRSTYGPPPSGQRPPLPPAPAERQPNLQPGPPVSPYLQQQPYRPPRPPPRPSSPQLPLPGSSTYSPYAPQRYAGSRPPTSGPES